MCGIRCRCGTSRICSSSAALIFATKTLQKFASVHGSFNNHFNSERHLINCQTYKLRRSAALAEWQSIMA